MPNLVALGQTIWPFVGFPQNKLDGAGAHPGFGLMKTLASATFSIVQIWLSYVRLCGHMG